jgi:hypothetical protein
MFLLETMQTIVSKTFAGNAKDMGEISTLSTICIPAFLVSRISLRILT